MAGGGEPADDSHRGSLPQDDRKGRKKIATFTLINRGKSNKIEAVINEDRVLVSAQDLHLATGWELKPEGLCRQGICRPVSNRDKLSCSDGVDLQRFADAVGNVLALDLNEGAAAMEDSAEQRSEDQSDLLAPDFKLPDLDGNMHALTDFRGKKILLVAWASW